jgi:hypothetical protein
MEELGSTAIAAESAGAVSDVSSGASSSGGAGDSGAVLTDDAILGITETGAESTTAVPEVKTETAATPAATPAELSIDDFKALFPTNPKLQSLWDKYDGNNKLVSQFGTVADARKAAETVQMLGGVQHLESLAQKAADVDQTDATFFSGRPEDRKSLASEWYDGGGPHEFAATSQAVAGMVDATLEVMRERDPKQFLNVMDRVTREALDAERFSEYLASLDRAVQSGQGLDVAAKQLLQWGKNFGLDKGKNGQPSPEAQRLAADRAKLDADRTSWSQQQQNAAVEAADTEIGTTLASEIDKALSELKSGARPVFGPNSTQIKATIAEKVKTALDAAVSKNPVLVAQVKSIQARGLTPQNAKQLIETTLRHARLMLPKVLEGVMEPWTKSVVSQAGATAERAKNGASKVDVGSGSTSASGTKPKFSKDELKKIGGYQKVSDDDILNAT